MLVIVFDVYHWREAYAIQNAWEDGQGASPKSSKRSKWAQREKNNYK